MPTPARPVWEARVAYPQDHYTITMAPRIAKGKVIIGASGGDRTTRGFFDAYDAATGHRAWRFYTVPGDPSKRLRERGDEESRRHVGRREGMVEVRRRRRGVGRNGVRSRGRSRLRRHRQRAAVDVPPSLIEGQGQSLRGLDPCGRRRYRSAEVALPGRARRQLGLRQRAASDPRGPADRRAHAQGDHAGEQERLLLRDRSDHGTVHLGAAVLVRHVGEGHRSEDRPADRERRGVLRHRCDPDPAGRRRGAQLVADVVQPDDGSRLHPDVDQQQLLVCGGAEVRPATGSHDGHGSPGANASASSPARDRTSAD